MTRKKQHCLEEMTDDRDKHVYKTVKIGDQVWMAENLNFDPGDVSGMGETAWSGCYNNESANCSKYGRLYTWEVAMDNAECAFGKSCSISSENSVQGICPEGWHLPSSTEWDVLWSAVGGSDNAGTKLKSTKGWSEGSDSFGFAVLPAGYRKPESNFEGEGGDASIWSSDADGAQYAEYWAFSNAANVGGWIGYKSYAFSVRCLKD